MIAVPCLFSDEEMAAHLFFKVTSGTWQKWHDLALSLSETVFDCLHVERKPAKKFIEMNFWGTWCGYLYFEVVAVKGIFQPFKEPPCLLTMFICFLESNFKYQDVTDLQKKETKF